MKLIVGLGNPGKEYSKTRHNAGFLALDHIASNFNTEINKKKFKSFWGKSNHLSTDIVLVKPQTYMNLSGTPVNNFARFFNAVAENIIVIHDDIDIDFGVVKIKNGGGHGGHNGIRDIVNKLGTKDFIRVKIGVGRPSNPNFPVDKYVLSNFSKTEQVELENVLSYTSNIVEKLIIEDVSEVMNEFNAKRGT